MSCIQYVEDVWVLTAQNEGFDRYIVGIYTSEELAYDSRDELGHQIVNTQITKSELFKRRK